MNDVLNLDEIKQYSYRSLAAYWRVLFGIEEMDVTSDTEDITDIDKSLDYPNLLEFRVSEATLQMNDPSRRFDPKSIRNIYRTIDVERDDEDNIIKRPYPFGYRLPVTIEAGFIDTSEPSDGLDYTVRKVIIFQGEIHKINRDIKSKTVEIVCVGEPQDIRDQVITDFGLEKTINIQGFRSSTGGQYPIPRVLTPTSAESVNGTLPSGAPMARIESLRTEGVLSETVFSVSEDQIDTEVAINDNARSDDFLIGDQPSFNLKSPYRDKKIETLIEKLLDIHDIEDPDIELPDIELDEPFFSSNGRVGYDFEHQDPNSERYNMGIPPGNFWRWTGFVTDFVVSGNRVMFLYSGKQTGASRTRIVEYNMENDTYYVRYFLPNPTETNPREFWSIIHPSGNFNDFYILSTDSAFSEQTPFGSYDSAESDNRPQILRFTRPDNESNLTQDTTPFIDNNNSYPPQLAQYYHLGFGRPGGTSDVGNNRLGSLPFSKKITIHGGYLYYLWARLNSFGVARKSLTSGSSEVILSAVRDTYQDGRGYNHAGCAYFIDENTDEDTGEVTIELFAVVTHIEYGMQTSRYRVLKIDLS